jgi:hypothetical protein
MIRLLESDYIVMKTGYQGNHWGECSKEYVRECRASLSDDLKKMPSFSASFEEIAVYSLPDGSEAQVYAKKSNAS